MTHESICVCRDIEKWASSRLPGVKDNITSVESGRGRVRGVRGGHLREVWTLVI